MVMAQIGLVHDIDQLSCLVLLQNAAVLGMNSERFGSWSQLYYVFTTFSNLV